MDVQALSSVEAETHEVFGSDIVSRQREGYDIGRGIEREKELAAVRMVVRVPEENAPGIAAMSPIGARRLGRVGEDVLAADGVVAAKQDIALPLADEHTFGGAALIAGVRIDRAPALRGPAHDLDRAPMGIVDKLAITLQRVGSSIDDVHGNVPQARGQRRIEIIEHAGRARFRDSVVAHGSVYLAQSATRCAVIDSFVVPPWLVRRLSSR